MSKIGRIKKKGAEKNGKMDEISSRIKEISSEKKEARFKKKESKMKTREMGQIIKKTLKRRKKF